MSPLDAERPGLHGIPCVILAGGLGTRLRAALPDLPKPMAPVAGRPFLAYLLEQVGRAGVEDVVLSVSYRADAIEGHFGDGGALGLRIRYTSEPKPMGTGGALVFARDLLGAGPALVMNGDSYCAVDLPAMLRRHRECRAAATLAAIPMGDASDYGTLELGPGDAILGFREKRPGAGHINAGIYLMERSVLDNIPAGRPVSLEREVFPNWAGRGLFAFRAAGPFLDIGTPERLAQAEALLAPGLALENP